MNSLKSLKIISQTVQVYLLINHYLRMLWRHVKIIEKVVCCMARNMMKTYEGGYMYNLKINLHGISKKPGLVLLLSCFVTPAILILRHTIRPPRPELQRCLQFELTCIPTLQQGHLSKLIYASYKLLLYWSPPAAWPSSPGHRPCLPSPEPSPAPPAQQTARGQPGTCQAAGG